MITREILKKIRQIELRTNRLVTETLAGFSFQPSPQFRRISRAMPDGADNHLGSLTFDNEEYGIRPRIWHFGFLGQPAGEEKSFRVLANRFEETLQLFGESLADSRLALVVKSNCIGKFPFRLLLNDHPKTHRVARNRFSMSATTSSSGRQRSGCASARSARRSSSAICSGVSSSSNRSRSFSKTSRCSLNGSLSTCSITCACIALMVAIYSFDLFAQARFFRRVASRSSISAKTCSAGIPRPGFFRASSARHSSSAICSGVSSSSNSVNSSKICWTVSRRSFSGIRRSSSRILVALMELNLIGQRHFASA